MWPGGASMRRACRRAVLAQLEAEYGPQARADAEAALQDPTRCDVFGLLADAGLDPRPTNADTAALLWATRRGYRNAPAMS